MYVYCCNTIVVRNTMNPRSFYLVLLILTVFLASPAPAQFSGKDSAILRESFLDSLTVGSKAKLKIHASVGCTTLHDIDIAITRQKEKYLATAIYRFESGSGEKWKKTAIQVKLNAQQLDSLRQIEKDMITAQKANDAAGIIVAASPSECSQRLEVEFTKRGRKKTYNFIVCEVGSFTRFTELFFGKVW